MKWITLVIALAAVIATSAHFDSPTVQQAGIQPGSFEVAQSVPCPNGQC